MLFPNKRKYIGIGIGQNELKNIGISAKIQYHASLITTIIIIRLGLFNYLILLFSSSSSSSSNINN